MCGRFNVDFEENKELKKILHELNKKYPGNQLKHGEVFPTDRAAIMVQDEKGKKIVPEISIWGFPSYQGKGVIINARSETAFEKKTFKESLILRRCVIPMSGFFEWDQQKNKYLFQDVTETIYVAGIYNFYKGVNHFTILTTAANGSMEQVHSRMPVVIEEKEQEEWIMDGEMTSEILQKVPKSLIKIRVN